MQRPAWSNSLTPFMQVKVGIWRIKTARLAALGDRPHEQTRRHATMNGLSHSLLLHLTLLVDVWAARGISLGGQARDRSGAFQGEYWVANSIIRPPIG